MRGAALLRVRDHEAHARRPLSSPAVADLAAGLRRRTACDRAPPRPPRRLSVSTGAPSFSSATTRPLALRPSYPWKSVLRVDGRARCAARRRTCSPPASAAAAPPWPPRSPPGRSPGPRSRAMSAVRSSGKAVGVVELEDRVAVDHLARRAGPDRALEQHHAVRERLGEALLLLLQHALGMRAAARQLRDRPRPSPAPAPGPACRRTAPGCRACSRGGWRGG